MCIRRSQYIAVTLTGKYFTYIEQYLCCTDFKMHLLDLNCLCLSIHFVRMICRLKIEYLFLLLVYYSLPDLSWLAHYVVKWTTTLKEVSVITHVNSMLLNGP